MYNSPFDIRMLAQSAEAEGLDGGFYREEMNSVCLMKLYKEYNFDKKVKLSVALHSCGIQPAAKHRAVSDCEDTLKLLRYMAKSRLSYEGSINVPEGD